MNIQEKQQLKRKIDNAKVVSFDVFDTLLYRRTNTPETVFSLVGKHFGVDGFCRLRMQCQDEASRRVYQRNHYPHADMDEIYAVLAEHTEVPVDWMAVKDYEIQMERNTLTANREMLDIFSYAKAQGKRVVATSDMYLSAQFLSEVLVANGFIGLDHIYCSADEHKAKFNKELFMEVAKQEGVDCSEILHVGDKVRDDVELPQSLGIQAFLYRSDADLDRLKDCTCTDVDLGLYKILADKSRGFWYNLGVLVGGPLYMGLYRFMRERVIQAKEKGQNVYFLSRDGFNLYQLFLRQGFDNVRYLYTSRRALLMACITEMNEQDIESLPPYDLDHTVGAILDFLCVDKGDIHHLKEAGLESFDQLLCTGEDIQNFRKLYQYDRQAFLKRCSLERDKAISYFSQIGFLNENALCFDCGWQGSSQVLLERFKKVVGCHAQHPFIYVGIKNGQKSRNQLHGMKYETWLCDFYTNYALQEDLQHNIVLYELFFTSPQASVFNYEDGGTVCFESEEVDNNKQDMLHGICDFVETGIQFVDKYDVETSPELAVAMLTRLIHFPTEEEAVIIGNLQNVDGFVTVKDQPKYIAWFAEDQLSRNSAPREIYWLDGLLRRPDVQDSVKQICASCCGRTYPEQQSLYHLEDESSILAYHRWQNYSANKKKTVTLKSTPLFSVVIPVYNTVSSQLEKCIQSVLGQTYDHFELILIDDHSSWENVVPLLKKYEGNSHIKVIYRTENGHISAATNDGIWVAKGDFIVFVDCDDFISPDSLYEFACLLNENPELDFIYSDEDKVTEDGKIFHMPHFKPDWSPDLFLNMMYTNHLAAYRATIVRQVGGLRSGYNGSQDYDFTLRFMEHSANSRVGHIPKVLYHWRERMESVAFAMSSKNYAVDAARRAKEDYIRRNNLQAYTEFIPGLNQHRIVYKVAGHPLVSIVIPSKDNPIGLKQCIDSIHKFTRYSNYEIIVVDNGSDSNNRTTIQSYLDSVGASYYYCKEDFNFSRMCNAGAKQAAGEYLLFLNDDIEIFQPEWMERMLGQAQQNRTGAVGAKLYYPLTTNIQHAGVVMTNSGPEHILRNADDQRAYYFGINWRDGDCIAVTGACLMLAKAKFDEVGGFDEGYPIAYNDVKLCFSLLRRGYYNVQRNDVVAYHYESLSRGLDQENDAKLARQHKEMVRLISDFPEFKGKDPFMSCNLNRYALVLDPKNTYDKLTDTTIYANNSERGIAAVVDRIETGEKIRVVGWALLEDGTTPQKLQRYLLVRDPFGRIYKANTLPMERNDVVEHFHCENYRYAGFESLLNIDEFRIDIMPYTLGILIIDRHGKQHVQWCKEFPVTRRDCPRPISKNFWKMDYDICQESLPEHVQWCVDTFEHRASCCLIRGFAFCHGNDHYRYDTKLILSDQYGEAYQFEVQRDERIDVAYSFVQEHFLLYTGFECYIYDGILKHGREYNLTIRLVNQFNVGDVLDINTGRKIQI